MANIYSLDQIRQVSDSMDFSADIAAGFVAHSRGEVVTPPVGELVFDDPPGDTHIKYGYIKQDAYFVIKIASGFYQNPQLGISSSSGLMLVFSQKTGVLDSVLLDEGYLTNVRTAVAGQIAASQLAPKVVDCIGVFGTGTMARMQVQYLKSVTDCSRVTVWGRSESSLAAYAADMRREGYEVMTTRVPDEVTSSCNLIVMTTPSNQPLVDSSQIRAGTHITAMGSDTAEKQELDSGILANADIVVTDSLAQCQDRGEIHHALRSGQIDLNKVVELGQVISDDVDLRRNGDEISVADLTGVAVQDIQIAKAVCAALAND